MSAPMFDAFLVLAQAPGGLTCFLMPRFRSDGSVNGLRFQRLKDKLGNRSNASAEVEFADAFAWRVGEEGRGVRTIIEMVQLTRLDCAIASAGLMRITLVQALHHARHRTVFQKRLAEQPLMQRVLAGMAVEAEAATALAMRLARSFDLAATDAQEAARARLLTPAVKFWICKRAAALICESMECLGGNGYVEESLLPRLYREAPGQRDLGRLRQHHGSGRAACICADSQAARSVLAGLVAEAGDLPAFREAARDIETDLSAVGPERQARALVERLALLAAAAALHECAPPMIGDIFARTRLAERRSGLFGTSAVESADADVILRRALTL
jgi:putative acyl-CoA dehydrogenase